MRRRLQAAWETRGWLARLLWPVSVLMAVLVAVRRGLYRWGILTRHRLPVPVVAIGNMAVGGTGKTPMAVAVVQHLQKLGRHPVVVSRGYGGTAQAPERVDPTQPAPERTGDEPLLLAQLTGAPVWVGRDRVATALAGLAAEAGADTVVLDDGMQHWRLAIDVLVVLFDERGLGNGWLLPAGLLREPWPPTTWNATCLWVQTRAQQTGQTRALPRHLQVHATQRRLATTAHNRTGERVPLTNLQERGTLGAVAGIAHPNRFFEMLKAQGLVLAHQLALPDHADASALLAGLSPGVRWLCTEKDAVKLFAAAPALDIWAVGLDTETDPAFWTALTQSILGLSSRDGRETA